MEKKKRDYVYLLVFMILSFVGLGVLPKIFPSGPGTPTPIEVVATIFTILWYVYCYRVTSNFYSSKLVRIAYAALLVFQLSLIAVLNMNDYTDISTLVVPATIGYLANLAGFSLVFYILLKDIFLEKHDLTYSLLGASNIYFMIPMLFCYLYALVAIQNPSLVHADPVEVKTLLYNSLEYSWYVVSGIDYPGEKMGEAIQSIGILEAISANLFIVFIIGRLMSK